MSLRYSCVRPSVFIDWVMTFASLARWSGTQPPIFASIVEAKLRYRVVTNILSPQFHNGQWMTNLRRRHLNCTTNNTRLFEAIPRSKQLAGNICYVNILVDSGFRRQILVHFETPDWVVLVVHSLSSNLSISKLAIARRIFSIHWMTMTTR